MTDVERVIGSSIAIGFWAMITAVGIGELAYKITTKIIERRRG
jgi:hypothetical protein